MNHMLGLMSGPHSVPVDVSQRSLLQNTADPYRPQILVMGTREACS